MNDRNREEAAHRWASAERCDYVVTLRDGGKVIDDLGEPCPQGAMRRALGLAEAEGRARRPSCCLVWCVCRGWHVLGHGGVAPLCRPRAVAGPLPCLPRPPALVAA